MQTPEPLNADWEAVFATLAATVLICAGQLASALTLVAKTCSKAIRDDPFEPLTKAEQMILDDAFSDLSVSQRRELASNPVSEAEANGSLPPDPYAC